MNAMHFKFATAKLKLPVWKYYKFRQKLGMDSNFVLFLQIQEKELWQL